MARGKKGRRRGKTQLIFKLLLIVITAIAVFILAVFILHLLGIITVVLPGREYGENGDGNLEVGQHDESINYENYRIERPDVEKYLQENATIISRVDVADSDVAFSEAEVYQLLNERGLADYPITYGYSITGEYNGITEISETSSERHPEYHEYFISESQEVWAITVIGRTITAMPVSYNMENSSEVELILAENEAITSYDGETDLFYIIIPNSDVMRVKVVDRIDADCLDYLTIGVLGE